MAVDDPFGSGIDIHPSAGIDSIEDRKRTAFNGRSRRWVKIVRRWFQGHRMGLIVSGSCPDESISSVWLGSYRTRIF